ncbi:crossover junction endonuclease eme1 [Chytriomyces hyalinus]|nr:crossover junction endonuclease eme1 [Chytriomyces hyalinus]
MTDSRANEVLSLCPHLSVQDIEADLLVSGSVEATINRVFDGLFLSGVTRSSTNVKKSKDLFDFDMSDDDGPVRPRPLAQARLFSTASTSASTAYQAAYRAEIHTNKCSDGAIVVIDSDDEVPLAKPAQRDPPPSKPAFKYTSVCISSDSDDDVRPVSLSSAAVTTAAVKIPMSMSSVGGNPVPLAPTRSWLDDYDKPDAVRPYPPVSRSNLPAQPTLSKKSEKQTAKEFLEEIMRKKYASSDSNGSDSDSSLQNKSYSAIPTITTSNSFSGSLDTCKAQQPRPKNKIKMCQSANPTDYGIIDAVSTSKRKLSANSDEESDEIPLTSNRNLNNKSLEKTAKQAERERVQAEKRELKRIEAEVKARQKELLKREKERKKLEEAEAKKSKSVLKEANKLRDKHTAVTEMILHIDPSFVSSPAGSQIASKLEEMGATVSISAQPLAHAIQWSRNVTRVWNESSGAWDPVIPARIEMEPFALVRVSATEFSNLIQSDGGVELFLATVKSAYSTVPKPLILLEGLKESLKLRSRLLDNQIRGQVRAMAGAAPSKSKAPSSSLVAAGNLASKDEIDAGLLWLQMFGNCFVQLAETTDEIVDLVCNFTTTIGTIPERRTRSEHYMKLNFGDSVKSGSTLQDCWKRMLMEVKPCSESVANSIIKMYPTYRSLMEAYRRLHSQNARESLLENLEVERIGSTKRMGPALSRKICLALSSEDAQLAIFEPPPPKKVYQGNGTEGRGFGGAGRGRGNPWQRARGAG